MNTRYSFFNSLLQNLGFIAAIAVAFSQYTLNDSFKALFKGDDKLFSSSSLVALIISIGLIIGCYAMRQSIMTKIYINPKSRDKYHKFLFDWSSKKQQGRQNITTSDQDQTLDPMGEPIYVTIFHLSFFCLIISLISFILLVNSQNWHIEYFLPLWYIFFICFSVFAISIFSIQLFREVENKQSKEVSNEIIFNKIRERFINNINVLYDETNPNYTFTASPDRHIIFEYNGGRYEVFTKSLDPNSYFNLVSADRELPPAG